MRSPQPADRDEVNRPLRYGWTTGACATAAAKAAWIGLNRGVAPDPVTISLPRGGEASFALAHEDCRDGVASVGIVKDAGDDPDVTHGVTVVATVRRRQGGIAFVAGEGVGTVTRAGLPVPVGEPAINPVPRQMIVAALQEASAALGVAADVTVTLSVPGGEALAARTWNPRLGIVGGLSILGTTGIVTPYSCAAWIHSIHRGIDVARAAGLAHVAASTGATSERAAQLALGLPDHAMLDMGDFAGAVLKYLAIHPVPRLTLAGGFAKLSKLAMGALDLHSSRASVDHGALARMAAARDASPKLEQAIAEAPTAMAALELARTHGVDLAQEVAARARDRALRVVARSGIDVGVMVVDRSGGIVAHV